VVGQWNELIAFFLVPNTKNQMVLQFASQSLLELVTKFWNTIRPDDSLRLRNFVLNYLGYNVDSLSDFVVNALSRTVARITRLRWFSNQENDLQSMLLPFLEVGSSSSSSGLIV